MPKLAYTGFVHEPCAICGEPVVRHQGGIEQWRARRFCSRSCSVKNAVRSKGPAAPRKRKLLRCRNSGEIKTIPEWAELLKTEFALSGELKSIMSRISDESRNGRPIHGYWFDVVKEKHNRSQQ